MADVAGARRGRPGYDRETVLRRAIEVFNRRGYDGTSISDLARELGLTKSAIYHHVESKESVLEHALDEALDALTAALDGVGTDGPAIDRLRRAVAASVLVLVDHLPAVTLMLRVHGNSDVEREAIRRRREVDARLADLVRAAVAEGSLRDDIPPERISRVLFGMVNSLVEWVRPAPEGDAVHLARAVTALAFDGLVVSPRGP